WATTVSSPLEKLAPNSAGLSLTTLAWSMPSISTCTATGRPLSSSATTVMSSMIESSSNTWPLKGATISSSGGLVSAVSPKSDPQVPLHSRDVAASHQVYQEP